MMFFGPLLVIALVMLVISLARNDKNEALPQLKRPGMTIALIVGVVLLFGFGGFMMMPLVPMMGSWMMGGYGYYGGGEAIWLMIFSGLFTGLFTLAMAIIIAVVVWLLLGRK